MVVVVGLLLVFGVLPIRMLGSSSWVYPSYARGFAVLLRRSVMLRWSEFAEAGSVGAATLNKLVLVPDLLEVPRLVLISVCHRGDGTRAEEVWSFNVWRLGCGSQIMGRAARLHHLQMRLTGGLHYCRWSYAACRCGRWAVLVASPWSLRTEGRSLQFLPTWKPNGRQLSFRTESTICACRRGGDLVVPSGIIPGGGEIQSSRRLSRTRLLFYLLVGGPLCKCLGPICTFWFVLGPVVKCVVSLPYK